MPRPVQKLLLQAGSCYAARIETETLLKSHLKTFKESTCNIICTYLESNLCRGSNGRARHICILEVDREAGCRDMMKREKTSIGAHLDPCCSMGQMSLGRGPSMTDIFHQSFSLQLHWFGWKLLSVPAFYTTSVFCSLDLKTCTYLRHTSEDIGKKHGCPTTGWHLDPAPIATPFSPLFPRDTCLSFTEWAAQGKTHKFRNCQPYILTN